MSARPAGAAAARAAPRRPVGAVGACSAASRSPPCCCSSSPRCCCRDFRLDLLAKYLCFAMVAVGIGLAWGRGGMLTLGQGVFFGLGGYPWRCTSSSPTPAPAALPDFMQLYGARTACRGGGSRSRARCVRRCLAILLLPALVAAPARPRVFRRRVRGAYFAILSPGPGRRVRDPAGRPADHHRRHQRPERLPGLLRLQPRRPGEQADAVLHRRGRAAGDGRAGPPAHASAATASCWWPCRDAEERVRFLGYDPANVKTRRLHDRRGHGGHRPARCSCPIVGIISPATVGIVPSIGFVIGVAVGGRATLLGPVLGAIAVAWAETTLSETFPAGWTYFQGCCSCWWSRSCRAGSRRCAACWSGLRARSRTAARAAGRPGRGRTRPRSPDAPSGSSERR